MSENEADAKILKDIISERWDNSLEELHDKLRRACEDIFTRTKNAIREGKFEPLSRDEVRVELDNVHINHTQFNSIFNDLNASLIQLNLQVINGTVYQIQSNRNNLSMKIKVVK